jgi:hypothetical protein
MLPLLIATFNFLLGMTQAQSVLHPQDWQLCLSQWSSENRANENNVEVYDYRFNVGPWGLRSYVMMQYTPSFHIQQIRTDACLATSFRSTQPDSLPKHRGNEPVYQR